MFIRIWMVILTSVTLQLCPDVVILLGLHATPIRVMSGLLPKLVIFDGARFALPASVIIYRSKSRSGWVR